MDLGERQLGFASAFDADLDNFAAAVGFARQACVSLSAEDGELQIRLLLHLRNLTSRPFPSDIEVETTGDATFEEAIYDPVQRILNQVRTVKISSMKLVERMEELHKQSAALDTEGHIPLRMLATSVGQATDVAVKVSSGTLLSIVSSLTLRHIFLVLQLAHKVHSYVNDIRSNKSPLQLDTILGFLRDITADATAGDGGVSSSIEPWDLIGMYVTRLGNDINDLLPKIKMAIEEGKVVKGELGWNSVFGI